MLCGMVCSGTYTDTIIIKFKQILLITKRNPASKQVRRWELTPETLSSDPHMWVHSHAHKHVCTKINSFKRIGVVRWLRRQPWWPRFGPSSPPKSRRRKLTPESVLWPPHVCTPFVTDILYTVITKLLISINKCIYKSFLLKYFRTTVLTWSNRRNPVNSFLPDFSCDTIRKP